MGKSHVSPTGVSAISKNTFRSDLILWICVLQIISLKIYLGKKYIFYNYEKNWSPMRTILGHQIGKYNLKSISGCKHAAHISK